MSISRDAPAAAAPGAPPTPPPIAPATGGPAGITTRPLGSFTAWLTVALNASPALAVRVVIVSLAASGTWVPAASISGTGAAGLGGVGFLTGVAFSGAALAGSVAGAGTSFMAAVDSVGARVRLRAVESADRLVCSPLTQASNAIPASVATSSPCFWSLIISSLSLSFGAYSAPNIGRWPLKFPG